MDRGEAAYNVTHENWYDEVARREREWGRRMPLPYQAPSALAGQLPMADQRYVSQYESVEPEHAVVTADSIAGRRQTQWGTRGLDVNQGIPWTARDQFGYGRLGVRGGGGYDEDWDVRAGRERRSGRLTAPNRFSQRVDPRFPFLRIVAKGSAVDGSGNVYDGNAHLIVNAGLSETGGAINTREFWLGGGFTAQFDMQGWDQATIEIVALLDGTNVQFAWVTNGLQADNQTLYLPQRIDPTGPAFPVPEGAYAIVIEDPAPGVPGTAAELTWTTSGAALPGDVGITIDMDDGLSGTDNQFGVPTDVLGTVLDINELITPDPLDVVWLLRPI